MDLESLRVFGDFVEHPPAFGLDPELTGLPGVPPAVGIHGSGRAPVLEARGSPLAGGQWQGAESVARRGIKSPKCWVVLACGTASERPFGVTRRGPLD